MKPADIACAVHRAEPGRPCAPGVPACCERVTAAKMQTFEALRDKPAGYRGAWRDVVVPKGGRP